MKNRFFSVNDIPLVIIYAARLLYPYRPFLDDYIQYHVYSMHDNPIKSIYFGIGLFASRPAASFLDIALWSHFWQNLGALYILFSVLYLVFLFALRYCMGGNGIKLGSLFMYSAALCPINIEATMWLSASTRIVGGLAFSMLCLFLISEQITALNKFLFTMLNFLSYCFYEQTAIFCFICVFFASVYRKKYFYIIAASVNMLLICVWYFVFARRSVFGYRSAVSAENVLAFPRYLFRALRAAFYVFADAKTCLLFIPPAFAAVRLFGCDCGEKGLKKALFGIVIIVFAFIPIALVGTNSPFRCLAVPMLGAFVLLDCIGGRVRKFVLCAVCSLFVVVSVNEFFNYYKSTVIDEKILDDLCEKITHAEKYEITDMPIYHFDLRSNHAEHIAAITSSDWALTGALRARLNDAGFLPD